MRATAGPVAVAVLACWLAVGAGAQTDTPQLQFNFGNLFPNPTGRNAYEDFTRAGDLLRTSAAWQEYEQQSGSSIEQTLAEKRHAISDPAVRAALDVLHSGLSKPIRSPHEHIDDETTFPELATFRALARALNVDMYVAFADGRVDSALSDLADGLQFAYMAQMDTLISGLVSIACDSIVEKAVAGHLDQLSARDCDRLLGIATDWLSLPDPAAKILASEHGLNLKALDKYRGRPAELLKLLNTGSTPSPETAAVTRAFESNPNSASPVFGEVASVLNQQFEAELQNLRLPYWERKDIKASSQDPAAQELIKGFGVADIHSRMQDRYIQDQAIVQMLGLHAAIRRYRWEHDRLPASLDEVRIGNMAIDPFVGKPFQYKIVERTRYELSSAGPFDRDAAANGLPIGARKAVKVPSP